MLLTIISLQKTKTKKKSSGQASTMTEAEFYLQLAQHLTNRTSKTPSSALDAETYPGPFDAHFQHSSSHGPLPCRRPQHALHHPPVHALYRGDYPALLWLALQPTLIARTGVDWKAPPQSPETYPFKRVLQIVGKHPIAEGML